MKSCLLSFCAVLLISGLVSADGVVSISGKVKKGADFLENVTVVAVNSKHEKVAEAVTDKDGKYELKDLTPGLYTLRAMAPKEKKLAFQESGYINLMAGKPVENDFKLRDMREETIVFPKGFNEKNTAQSLAGIRMVQLSVGNNTTANLVTTGLNLHYPANASSAEASEGLIWFDLSSIPSNAQIVSAKLSLYCSGHLAGSNKISMHRALVPWTEKANWFTYDGVNEWKKEGGTDRRDIDRAIEGTTDVPQTGDKAPQWFDFEVTNMVQKWVSKEAPNYGMKSKTTGTASVCMFRSATYNGTNFIKLTVVVGK